MIDNLNQRVDENVVLQEGWFPLEWSLIVIRQGFLCTLQDQLVSWCLESSQPQRITSGLKQKAHVNSTEGKNA